MNHSPQITSLARLFRSHMAKTCIFFLFFMVCAAIFGPFFTGYGYEQTSNNQFSPPSYQHLCGTDIHGRDLLTRILYGARISLAVGLVGALVSLTVGVSYGMISGY